jgi:hypothetical protein
LEHTIMSTWSTEVAALAAEIQQDEDVPGAVAFRTAATQLAELEQFAARWDMAASAEAEALDIYAQGWDVTAAAARQVAA